MTFKFDGWHRKTLGHLFFTTSSFVHLYKSISEFKLELQSGNAQFGSKSAIVFARVTLKFDRWHWKTIGHLLYTTLSLCIIWRPSVNSSWSCSPEMPNLGQNRRFFVPCDHEIWQMTLKNNRAPLLCCFNSFCASFRSHHWIQTGVTVRKHPIWVKIVDFFSRVTLKFDGWPWKTIGHLS